MALPTIKGGFYESVDAFEREMKQRSTGPITKIQETPIVVRFLTDPDRWFGYEEHYTEEFKVFPCTGDGCPGCDEGARAASRSLAPALDVNTKRPIVLTLPKTLGESLLRRYKRNRTLTDRDFELLREGEGLDTKYEALPSEPKKRNLDSYEVPDLEKALFLSCSEEFRDYVGLELETGDEDEVDVDDVDDWDVDDEEEEEEAPRRKASSRTATRKSSDAARKKSVPARKPTRRR